MEFVRLPKLSKGDRIAVVSPSFGAPGKWPQVYELGLRRVGEVFGLEPVEFPATRKLGASKEERARDLIAAFEDSSIKAVIASLGGDDQVTYVKNLPIKPFTANPKPFFGYSDNTNFMNHLWLNGVPSYYGGMIFTEFAMQISMDDFTVRYLKEALFGGGKVRLESSPVFNDIGLDWSDPVNLNRRRQYDENEGWYWDGGRNGAGVSWGGCLESLDELLRHDMPIPSLHDFESVVLFVETCEEISPSDYVGRVFRALGERGILERVQALLVGRPKAWEFDCQLTREESRDYKRAQREVILNTVRQYNREISIVQNLDFGHTAPQICLPMGGRIEITAASRTIEAEF
jgi:muramoyltetrapeptide carboxypeptidase LdcA involved in peptidoglycan recycling